METFPYVIEGFQLTRCPLKYLGSDERNYLQAFFEYRNGFLPNNGGWLNQPLKFSEVISFISKVWSKLEEEKMRNK